MNEIHHCDECNLNFPHSAAPEEHYSTAFHLQRSGGDPSPPKQSVPNASKPSCPVCKKSFKRPQDLRKHRKAKGHELAGIGNPVTPNAPPRLPSASASTSAQAQAQAQAPSGASSNSYCTTCAKQFGTATGLQQHQSSKKHQKRVRRAARASAPPPATAPDPAITPTPADTTLSQADAPSTATATTTGLGPVEEFFASYAFSLDHNANYEAEFTRLCDVQGWSVGDSQLAEVTKNFRAAQVKAFGSARVKKVARVRQEAVKDAICEFFERYNFAFNPKEHHRDEYDRLCQERKWSKKKKEKAKKLLREAEVVDFGDLFGTDPNDPESWRKLCETARIEPIPERLEMRRQVCLLTLLSWHPKTLHSQ